MACSSGLVWDVPAGVLDVVGVGSVAGVRLGAGWLLGSMACHSFSSITALTACRMAGSDGEALPEVVEAMVVVAMVVDGVAVELHAMVEDFRMSAETGGMYTDCDHAVSNYIYPAHTQDIIGGPGDAPSTELTTVMSRHNLHSKTFKFDHNLN